VKKKSGTLKLAKETLKDLAGSHLQRVPGGTGYGCWYSNTCDSVCLYCGN
jgi:hypothetical protein